MNLAVCREFLSETFLQASAHIHSPEENHRGKGNVVRRMFSDIDADVYVMTDGDETYDLSRCKDLINYLHDNNLDMVVGARKEVRKYMKCMLA